jgi:hypothetical protein
VCDPNRRAGGDVYRSDLAEEEHEGVRFSFLYRLFRRALRTLVSIFGKIAPIGERLYWQIRLGYMGKGARVRRRTVIYQASRVRVGPCSVLNDFVR